ncbi:MAG TPA: S41 family peptidase [Verrucomicrobiae bacterium]|nr:S41 family peptidase [Verrucomicrobiae bacterium]
MLGILSVFVLFSVLVVGTIAGVVISNYDHLGRLAKVVGLIKADYIGTVTPTQLIDGAMKGIVDSLGDKYSVYLDPKENEHMNEVIEGRFGGVGIIISLKDEKRLVVLKPIKNSPADRAGIKANDMIVKIDDTETSTITQEQAISMMRGKEGTKVNLTVYRESDKKMHTLEVVRELINVPTVEAEMLPSNNDIGYINISQFSTDTGTELGKELTELLKKNPKGIILDLRYNHGGELNSAVKVASFFVPKGPVVYIVDKYGNTDEKQAVGNYLGIPLVVLVNEESASASEIVAGAILDKKTGTLVGTKTFGKGIVQTIYQLDGGSGVKLTTAKYLTPNKNDINLKGIEPDIKVELAKGQTVMQPPEAPKDYDDQLNKAIEVLKTKF